LGKRGSVYNSKRLLVKQMKVLFITANRFGYELIKTAINIKNIDVLGVITLKENTKTIMYDKINMTKWKELNIKLYLIENINQEYRLINNLKPELIIVCGWRQIIKKEIIEIPKKGTIGFHPTLLPVGRGSAPIINSIKKGFKRSGITMFYIGEGLDDGDIIDQRSFTIEHEDYANDIYEKCIVKGKKLLEKNLPLLIKNEAPRIPQDESKATYFEKPKLKENKIDITNESVEEIYLKIKALSKPYKGAYIEKDKKRLIIWKAEIKKGK
jgi:methionyl-tRNA formyltransferase